MDVYQSLEKWEDAKLTSLWRQNDVAASLWSHNDVIIASCVRWVLYLVHQAAAYSQTSTPGRSLRNSTCLKPLTCGDRVNSVWLGQYHGCWCPGSLRRQDISSHDIDYVEYVGPGLTWGRILSTCVILMWSNDIKCKYMFVFPLKNLARKGLTRSQPCRLYLQYKQPFQIPM